MRRVARWVASLIGMATLFAAAPAFADASIPFDEAASKPIAKQLEMLADAGIGSLCRTAGAGDEIIVCGGREVPPTPPEPPRPRLIDIPGVQTWTPTAGMVGAGVTVRGCFLQKCPKEVILIDLASIPVAAPGSEADLISRGLIRSW